MDTPVLRLAAVSLDCADAAALAYFYVRLLDAELLWAKASSAGVRSGHWVLVAQQVTDYREPAWPGSSVVHLDLSGDLAVPAMVDRAVQCGARVAAEQPDERWTVLLDPAGHPFCITPFAIPALG